MHIIALDEQGDFENLKNERENKPVFIGGVIYDDCDEKDDYGIEKQRLQEYMRNLCISVGCNYPRDLHCVNDKSNSGRTGRIKRKFATTIAEYFRDGTWEGRELVSVPRKGKYYIFALLRGKNGKKNLLAEGVSEVIKDDFASNLYVHMAEDVVERLMFHNPVIRDIRKVRLELATRRIVLTGANRSLKMNQYNQLGYKAIQRNQQGNSASSEYLLTNPDIYRTAVEREMLKCGQEKILIDRIAVKSIYYDYPTKGMDFLYLADAICSYLGFQVQDNNPASWIVQFEERCAKINCNTVNLIWAYDEVDDCFSKAWEYFEKQDYYGALSIAFDGCYYKSEMTDFYKEKWFCFIGNYIDRQADISAFSMAVKKYHESLLNNNLNQEKLVYIFSHLETMSKNIQFSSYKDEAELYYLYDSGISAYIHIGNLAEAKRCFEKAKKYAEYVATEAYLRTRNKMVVFLCDRLDYEEALDLADENVLFHERLTEMKRVMFGKEFSEALNHAIALSQRAQVYASMNDERAEKDFCEALQIMDDGTPDRYITQSYLMHYYICQRKKAEYEALAKEYFGNRVDLVEQFNYIAEEGAKVKNAKFSMKYALYMYIKALYVFYLDIMPEKMVNKLTNIEKSLCDINESAYRQVNGHPWEIIYKYLSLIMISQNKMQEAEKYKKLLETHFGISGGLIKDITDASLDCLEKKMNGKEYIEKFTYMYC